MIPQDTIEQIRAASDIGQVVGEYVRLKKQGRHFIGLCPFHTEKTPSFKVNSDRQIYHCFGCGKGGNVFGFLMEHEKMSFVEAVRHLARKANIQIRETVSDGRREELERLNFAHQIALEYYEKLLHETAYRSVLEGYLRKSRGLTEATIAQFRLGVSGESWDGLLSFASRKSLSAEDLARAGLAILSETSKTYHDRFRQRLMIPIFNLSQKPMAFGGRTLKKGEPVKYINSPETPLYSKGQVLYGLNFSRDFIREAGSAYIVEGYFDLISLFQVGVKNAVASSGTAFTPPQARLLARFCDEVYLFFDADSAGQNAALRSVEHLYDAGLEVKVMQTPSGEDPDTVARKYGSEKIEQLRRDVIGYIPFRIRRVNMEHAGIIAKEKLVKELGALGAKIGDPTRRSLFYAEAASTLSVDPALFRLGGPMESQTFETRSAESKSPSYSKEKAFLSLLLCNPGSLDFVFETVSPDDLESRTHARLYGAIMQQYRQEGIVNPAKLLESFADDSAISALTELATTDWEPHLVEKQTRDIVRDFRELKLKRLRVPLTQAMAQAEAAGDHERANAIIDELKKLGLTIDPEDCGS